MHVEYFSTLKILLWDDPHIRKKRKQNKVHSSFWSIQDLSFVYGTRKLLVPKVRNRFGRDFDGSFIRRRPEIEFRGVRPYYRITSGTYHIIKLSLPGNVRPIAESVRKSIG